MELGEKLRQARLAAGLSQRQLCGETITRNMLSQIESGKAKPSMTTLQYLAGRLNKPVSYFLDDGGSSPGDAALENARQAYAGGRFQQALDALETCQKQTDEAVFLKYLCLLMLGSDALAQRKLPYARQLLEKAGLLQTLYKTVCLEQQRQLLLLEAGGVGALPADDRPLLMKAQKALENKDFSAAVRYLEACDQRGSRWALLRGTAYFLSRDFKAALEVLKQAEKDFPKEAIPMLENCCKELDDYKQAYYYACLQR